ncbi:MAG: BRCT domain-containing protein [Patulibacter sp.]|nr:BRCT domain-containing protein [Patulibacter sp.]
MASLCDRLGIVLVSHHDAAHDAFACAQLGAHLMSTLDVSSMADAYGAALRMRQASPGTVVHRYTRRSSHPKIGPGVWTDEDVSTAQRAVDLWLAGAKLREIDEQLGTALGSAGSLMQRLRKNGLPVPAKTRGRGATWDGPVPESLTVTREHLGRRLAMASDTPADARVVVFTGEVDPLSQEVDRSTLEAAAATSGWIVRGSVSRRTTVVVVCDPLFTGTKRQKAIDLGIRCVSPAEFVAELNAGAQAVVA